MRAACAHAPRAWRARGGAPLLAFLDDLGWHGGNWDDLGGPKRRSLEGTAD